MDADDGWSFDYGYEAARGARSRALRLAGPTFENRSWIRSKGGEFDRPTKTWTIPTPTNNAARAQLLYEIVKRGMKWRAEA